MAASTDKTTDAKAEAGGAGTYRVVNVFVIYDDPKEQVLGGRKRVLQVRRTARFGEEVDLSASEAERLLSHGAVVPAGEPRSYDEMYMDELEKLADERGLTVSGSGANGHVLKDDLVKALNADDAQKGVPAA